jgi:hypothetical protein
MNKHIIVAVLIVSQIVFCGCDQCPPVKAGENCTVSSKESALWSEFIGIVNNKDLDVSISRNKMNGMFKELSSKYSSNEVSFLYDRGLTLLAKMPNNEKEYGRRLVEFRRQWELFRIVFLASAERGRDKSVRWDLFFIFLDKYSAEISCIEGELAKGNAPNCEMLRKESHLRKMQSDLNHIVDIMRRFFLPRLMDNTPEDQKRCIIKQIVKYAYYPDGRSEIE